MGRDFAVLRAPTKQKPISRAPPNIAHSAQGHSNIKGRTGVCFDDVVTHEHGPATDEPDETSPRHSSRHCGRNGTSKWAS